MHEELQRLRKSVQLVKVEISFLRAGVSRLDEKARAMVEGLDVFIGTQVTGSKGKENEEKE